VFSGEEGGQRLQLLKRSPRAPEMPLGSLIRTHLFPGRWSGPGTLGPSGAPLHCVLPSACPPYGRSESRHPGPWVADRGDRIRIEWCHHANGFGPKVRTCGTVPGALTVNNPALLSGGFVSKQPFV